MKHINISVRYDTDDSMTADFFVGNTLIGSVYLDYQSEDMEQGADSNEWLLSFKNPDREDPDIIIQGHHTPS